jgi:MHS family citrate/tricarballylate:H+ symporter-like MFS transporter
MIDAAMGEMEVPATGILKRHIAACIVGNALEFYDFTTYSFFAVQIGHALFPGHDPFFNLMLSLAGFGAGFISRPLGGIVIGAYGDRAGRKPAMLLSFALMGLGILGLALVPSYATIGMAAPVLAVLFRLLQGFALGGDVGPTTAFLIEAAAPKHRGFYTSLQFASQGLAVASGGLVGTILASTLDTASLEGWGWRFAFLLGAAVLPFGLYVRRTLPETFEPRTEARPTTALRDLTKHVRVIVLGFLMLTSSTVATYTLLNMTPYAQAFLHMRVNLTFAATLVLGIGTFLFSFPGGALSDRIGRRPVMIWPRVALLLVTWPLFVMLASHRDALWLLGATMIITALNSLSAAVGFAALAEALPKELRSGSLAVIYAVAISVFGGTTQLIETWLIHTSGSVLAPAWYLMGATLVGAVAMAMMQETAPVRMRAQ